VHIQQDAHGTHETTLTISREPVQISGRFYALVTILGPEARNSDRYRVVHFNRATRQFDGPEEVVRLPVVVPNENGLLPATNQNIEHSPVNAEGWYISGAQDRAGCFVVQSLVPRALLRVQPQRTITNPRQARTYLKQTSWENIVTHKGQVGSALLAPRADSAEQALADWQAGDRALLVHVYGGIGGSKREPAASTGLYFGHFAYGIAEVTREPLADELLFRIEYEQVYTHNGDGLVAGTLDWTRYMGDRQYGWLGIRPVCDMLIKLDAFTTPYRVGNTHRAGLDVLARMLETMTARYRIGDGTGGTYVAAANNCAQDSNQALYGAIKQIEAAVKARPDIHAWLATSSPDVERFQRLLRLNTDLHRKLLPLGTARADWQYQAETLGISLEEHPLRNVLTGLRSWRTMLPRVANNVVGEVFLNHGASVWVLSTSQVGGHHPDIEPLPPLAW
jgi:predicted Abi (CAAX) family protease